MLFVLPYAPFDASDCGVKLEIPWEAMFWDPVVAPDGVELKPDMYGDGSTESWSSRSAISR